MKTNVFGLRVLPVPRRVVAATVPEMTQPLAISPTEVAFTVSILDAESAEFIEIARSDNGGPYSIVQTIDVTTEEGTVYQVTDTGRTAGVAYAYKARTRIDSLALRKHSPYTLPLSVTMPSSGTLGQVTNLNITEDSRDADEVTYDATWDAVTGATSYDYWFEPSVDGGFEDGNSGAPNNQVGTGLTGVVIPREADQNECVLVVAPRNASGRGAETRLPFYYPGNLLPPTSCSVDVTDDDVEVSFTESDQAEAAVEYDIERNDGAGWSVIASVAAGLPAPQYPDVDLADGTYRYRVRPKDALDATGRHSPEGVAHVSTGGGVGTGNAVLFADLGDLTGDPTVAPISLGAIGAGNGGYVASGTNGTAYGSTDIEVVADPTGQWPGLNVVQIRYPRTGALQNPDVNRSFEDTSPININLGERMAFELEFLFDVDDPLRAADQRKITYFKSSSGGGYSSASTFVLNSESERFRITVQNPLYQLPGGGVRDRRINIGPRGTVSMNTKIHVYCELHMNTKSFDTFVAEANAIGDPALASRGDGRIILVVNGVTLLDVNDVIIMSDYGNTGQKPLWKFEIGKQWQGATDKASSPIHTEYRYYRKAKLWKLP
jgi:hypothetical protein